MTSRINKIIGKFLLPIEILSDKQKKKSKLSSESKARYNLLYLIKAIIQKHSLPFGIVTRALMVLKSSFTMGASH
jgi:hypothetical protein